MQKLNKVFHSTYVTAGFPKNSLIILAKVLTTQKKICQQYHKGYTKTERFHKKLMYF